MDREDDFVNFYLVVGLGNPGSEFVGTAHNVGRDFLIDWAKERGERFESGGCKNSLTLRTTIADKPVILMIPETYMNRSGLAVLECMKYFKINLRQICIIQDDSDLLIGQTKLVTDQSSGGHKGIESIISSLKNKNFTRLKVGIRPENLAFSEDKGHIKAERFVLKKINSDDKEKILKKVENDLSAWLEKGTALAMNVINRKR